MATPTPLPLYLFTLWHSLTSIPCLLLFLYPRHHSLSLQTFSCQYSPLPWILAIIPHSPAKFQPKSNAIILYLCCYVFAPKFWQKPCDCRMVLVQSPDLPWNLHTVLLPFHIFSFEFRLLLPIQYYIPTITSPLSEEPSSPNLHMK